MLSNTVLNQGYRFQFEFQRTVSRLIEMQTREYLALDFSGFATVNMSGNLPMEPAAPALQANLAP